MSILVIAKLTWICEIQKSLQAIISRFSKFVFEHIQSLTCSNIKITIAIIKHWNIYTDNYRNRWEVQP